MVSNTKALLKIVEILDYKSLFRTVRYASQQDGVIVNWKAIILAFIRCIFFKIRFREISTSGNQYCILNSYTRSDYTNYISKLMGILPATHMTIELKFSIGFNFYTYSAIKKSTPYRALPLRERLTLLFLFKNLDTCVTFLNQNENVLYFAEMQLIENFIVQLAKNEGFDTIGLQHGFYAEDTDEVTLNQINYQNISVNTLLVWGQKTADLITKYNESVKTKIVGRPTTHFLDKTKLRQNEGCYTSVLCILDAEEFSETNINLITFAELFSKSLSIPIIAKCHPISRHKYPLNKDQLYHEILNVKLEIGSSPLIIGCRSSLLLELAVDGFSVKVIPQSPFYVPDVQQDTYLFDNQIQDLQEVTNYIEFASPQSEIEYKNVLSEISEPRK